MTNIKRTDYPNLTVVQFKLYGAIREGWRWYRLTAQEKARFDQFLRNGMACCKGIDEGAAIRLMDVAFDCYLAGLGFTSCSWCAESEANNDP